MRHMKDFDNISENVDNTQTFILVDPETDKVLVAENADITYYFLVEGEIPINSMIFDEETYNDFIRYETTIYLDDEEVEIDLEKLVKKNIGRK